jgi:hypothetical protein
VVVHPRRSSPTHPLPKGRNRVKLSTRMWVLAKQAPPPNPLWGSGLVGPSHTLSRWEQVGLLGMARDLQKDLDQIADKADTSTDAGLHYLMTEAVLALLRNPEYWVYACSASASERSPEAAEQVNRSPTPIAISP